MTAMQYTTHMTAVVMAKNVKFQRRNIIGKDNRNNRVTRYSMMLLVAVLFDKGGTFLQK